MSSESAARRVGFRWRDYLSWPDDRRWEIIGGDAYAMTPAPSPHHQTVLLELCAQMRACFQGKRCRVFIAPVDVKLSEQDVVQPDIVVVCEGRKVRPTHIEGAPSLVVEILSPSSVAHDRVRKLALYARSGVKEVWLITPYPWLAEVLVLAGDSYRLRAAYDRDGILRSARFRHLEIQLRQVFSYPIGRAERVDMVREARPPYATRSKRNARSVRAL
jgi:Uma2 family endonuclease